MKKDYFENLPDAEIWRQKSENNNSLVNDVEFLKYRLNQVGNTEYFNETRQQQPSYPKVERVSVQPQIWDEHYTAKSKPRVNIIALIRRLIMFALIAVQTYYGTTLSLIHI